MSCSVNKTEMNSITSVIPAYFQMVRTGHCLRKQNKNKTKKNKANMEAYNITTDIRGISIIFKRIMTKSKAHCI